MDRRKFLGLVGGLGGPLAGCLGQASPARPTPSSSPTATATDVAEAVTADRLHYVPTPTATPCPQ